MPKRENSNMVGLDPVEHGTRPPRSWEDQLRPYLGPGERCRFRKLANLHDRGLYRRSEFKAGTRPLRFEKIECGLKFVLC